MDNRTASIRHSVNQFLAGQLTLAGLHCELSRIADTEIDKRTEEMLTKVERVLLDYVDGDFYDHKIYYALKRATRNDNSASKPKRRKR